MRTSNASKVIMRLSDEGVVDDQPGTNYQPVNTEVLKKMFGTTEIKLKETYHQAMSIALNTPDVALIQGPPGTGKTTLICGIITRLNIMNRNFKILVSSEQHEALDNLVHRLSGNRLIPPFVLSRRFETDQFDANEEKLERNIKEFQANFQNVCDEILSNVPAVDRRSDLVTECVYLLYDLRQHDYSVDYLSSIIDQLKRKVMMLGCYESMTDEFVRLQLVIKNQTRPVRLNDDFVTQNIIRKIQAQRVTVDSFQDDGWRQLKDLQELLKRNNLVAELLPENLSSALSDPDVTPSSAVFSAFVAYVDRLKNKFIPRASNEFTEPAENIPQLVNVILAKLQFYLKNSKRDFNGIIETLKYRLNDLDNVGELIKNYTTVYGSTCAQADKNIDLLDLLDQKYDYIIIDEAARANPLDIMIPMMLGTKVILIGDQRQLPHYIETRYVKKFVNEKSRYANFNEQLLTKPLFQIIYENLEKAYRDKRLKFRRTIQIDEQHRMHPVIGNFISREFYDGTIKNGENTINRLNDYHVMNGKNVAWIDVKIFQGPEIVVERSLAREAEVVRIIELLKELLRQNPNRNLNIGIISFYKAQVKILNALLKENFSQEVLNNIFCNTVDSYQGREFDIVILSGVRSNNYGLPTKSLGFINESDSRINVALSRARRLLIVVADADTYQRNPHFRNFIDYVKKEGYYGE